MKKLLVILALSACALGIFGIGLGFGFGSLAHAAPDAGVAVAASSTAAVSATPADASFWQSLASAALSKDWILLTGLVLVLLQYGLKAEVSPLAKWVPWINTTAGGWVFNLVVSFAGTLGLDVVAKHELSWQLVLQTLLLVATSTAAHHGIKDVVGAKTQE